MVGPGVEDAADHGTPSGSRTAEHHHHQQGEGEVGGGRLRSGAACQQQVHDAAERGQGAGQDEGGQLEAVRTQAQYLHPAFVLLDALPDPADGRADRPLHDGQHEDEVGQGDPVQAGGVLDAHQRGGQPVGGRRPALLTAGEAAGVALHENRAGLGEGQGHHGERDAADPETDRAQQEGKGRTREESQQRGHGERQARFEHHDVGDVRAGGEVQRVPEGEQSGTPEQQVVAGGQRPEHQAQSQQLKVAGAPDRPFEQDRQRQRAEGDGQEDRQQQGGPPADGTP